MNKEQSLERIMDAIFGAGYLSPHSAQVYQYADMLLELIRPENLVEATGLLVMIGTSIREDGAH